MTFIFHSDPGHGWVQVSLEYLNTLHLANRISSYSYMDLNTRMAYLEEDRDASLLIEAVKNLGHEVEFRNIVHNDICFIRDLHHFVS